MPVSPSSLISSGVSVSGPIRRLQLALAPETDKVTHVDPGDEAPKDSHPVEFEGMESLMGETCFSFRVFLGRLTSAEKPAPFWLVERTDAEEAANMGLAKITVAVWVSAEIRGHFTSEGVCKNLEHYVSPDVEVQVILPLFVNSRTLERGDKLCHCKNRKGERRAESLRRGRWPQIVEEATNSYQDAVGFRPHPKTLRRAEGFGLRVL